MNTLTSSPLERGPGDRRVGEANGHWLDLLARHLEHGHARREKWGNPFDLRVGHGGVVC